MFTREELLKHYKTMVKIRKFDEEAKRARENNEIAGSIHPYIGEEAIATAVCACLEKTDFIESTHRGHGHTIAKGADMRPMMAELYGKKTGSCHGKGGSMHIADFSIGMLGANGIVGGGFGLAAGAALASRFRKTGAVSVVFFGDGSTNRGTFHETANLVSAWHLPVVFICENNGIAASTPFDSGQQSVEELYKRAAAYNIKGERVNGNDFFAVYEAAKRYIDRARKGEGNCCGFLECMTHRPFSHFVCEDQSYRDADAAYAKFLADDCIKNYEKTCLDNGWLSEEDFKAIQDEVSVMIKEAVQFALDSPYPEESDLYTDIYD